MRSEFIDAVNLISHSVNVSYKTNKRVLKEAENTRCRELRLVPASF